MPNKVTSAEAMILIDRYVEGTLDELAGTRLLQYLDEDPEVLSLLADNVELDHLLVLRARRIAIQTESQKMEPDESASREDSSPQTSGPQAGTTKLMGKSPSDEPVLSWDELVALQNAERPVSEIVRQYQEQELLRKQNRRIVRKFIHWGKVCFLPSRSDWENSSAPLITWLGVLTLLIMAGSFFLEHLFSVDPTGRIVTVARVNETVDAVWEDGADTYSRGQLVNSCSFQLKSGIVQLEMNNGTTLILNGPVNLALTDAMKAFCQSGQVSVHVPKAGHGYELSTPYGSVIDRGTEFFVDVTKGKSILQTIKGRVDFLSAARELIPVFESQGLSFDQSFNIEKIANISTSRYIAPTDFISRVERRAEKVKELQNELKTEQAKVPDLILQLDLDKDRSKELANSSSLGSEYPIRCLGGRCVDGALFGTKSWIFESAKQGISVDLGGPYSSMTIEAVVRYEPCESLSQVILASSELFESSGTFLWQVTKEGCLQVQITAKQGDSSACYTTIPVLEIRQRGTWVRLRLVLDAESKQILQYVDKRRIPQQSAGRSTVVWHDPVPLKPSEMTIGNYRGKTGKENSRSLNMPLSEMSIWSSAIYDQNEKEE